MLKTWVEARPQNIPTHAHLHSWNVFGSFLLLYLNPTIKSDKCKDSLCSHPHDNRWQDAAQASSLAN